MSPGDQTCGVVLAVQWTMAQKPKKPCKAVASLLGGARPETHWRALCLGIQQARNGVLGDEVQPEIENELPNGRARIEMERQALDLPSTEEVSSRTGRFYKASLNGR